MSAGNPVPGCVSMVGNTVASESDAPGLGDPARWRYWASEVGTLLVMARRSPAGGPEP
jgi:hypothetical protein